MQSTSPQATRDTQAPSPRLNETQRQALENRITELAAHIHAATAQLLELIRQFDEGGGWHGDGLRSCAHWLNWKCGIDLGAAREKVRVAKALAALPRTPKNSARGEISYSKVRAMTRVATPETERYLLMIARHGTAAHMERLVRHYRRVKRIEALEQANDQHRLRSCTLCSGCGMQQLDMWVMSSSPPGRQRTHSRGLHQSQHHTHRPAAADALVRMAQGAAGAPAATRTWCTCTPPWRCSKPMVMKGNQSWTAAETFPRKRHGAWPAMRAWCIGAKAEGGKTLDIGRKSRSVPPALRRALQRRDGGCRFPGCTCTRFVDAHHVKHWADGGETALDNLVLLCRHHHRLVHEGGFGLRVRSGGQLQFSRPDGRALPDSGATRFRGNVHQLMRANRELNPSTGPRTGACRWLGERMDDDLALSALL